MENRHTAPVAANGRMNLPAPVRATLELEGGGKVVFIEKENGEIEITTLRRSLQRARDLVRKYIPNGEGIVDELIAERRAEAAREAAEDDDIHAPAVSPEAK